MCCVRTAADTRRSRQMCHPAAEGKEREDVVSIEEGYVRRNNQKRQKRAVRVDEIGPRMEIRRVKVTEGALGIECALIYQ